MLEIEELIKKLLFTWNLKMSEADKIVAYVEFNRE